MVTTTSAISGTQAQTSINESSATLVSNYQTFLTLLTTQLKNQDPTKPLDNNEFTQQLTQMTGVEQQLLSNQLLTTLVNQNSGSVTNAVGLIGKVATVNTNSNMLTGSKAEWIYDAISGTKSATIQIKDSTGKVVYSGPVTDVSAGRHTFTWNGTTTSGSSLPDGGPYTAIITTKDAQDKSATLTPIIQGLVTGVESVNGSILLSLGKNKVPSSAVIGVTNPA